jgi:hypothetical protein
LDLGCRRCRFGNVVRDLGMRHLERTPRMAKVFFDEAMSLTDDQRAALLMLAWAPRRQSVSTLAVRGFTFEMLQNLVGIGLATAHRDIVGIAKTKRAYLRITATGRKAIAE